MPDAQPTVTVAGQSIALHVTSYPDVPNRWGSGSIRVASLRLDYGSSISPDARRVFVVGAWVRDDGEVTDASVDRYYDAPSGDMSDWPDWIADLTRKHDPSAVPDPSSAGAAEQTALRDRIRRAVCEAEGFAWDSDMLEPDEYGEVADAVLTVLSPPADQAVLREAADDLAEFIALHGPTSRTVAGWRGAVGFLRRMADEAQQPTPVAAFEPRANETGGTVAEAQQQPTDEDVVEAHRLALSFALGLGTGG